MKPQHIPGTVTFMPHKPVTSDSGKMIVATLLSVFMTSFALLDASATSMDTFER
jgi:hypothetical protein